MCSVSNCSGCVIARSYKASSYLLAKQVAKLDGLADRYACVLGVRQLLELDSGQIRMVLATFWRDSNLEVTWKTC